MGCQLRSSGKTMLFDMNQRLNKDVIDFLMHNPGLTTNVDCLVTKYL